MGKPSPGVELAVLDANGETLVNAEGDIAVLITPTSENLIFKGYRKEVDGSIQIIRPERVDKHGRRWYNTGDRAYLDDDGYFWFIGRDDDVSPRARLTSGNKFLGIPNWSV
jgi:acyl-coenzyme A synthetase/AMP-(fatty) acid ligase